MKVLFLTKYSRKGASSRYRTFQFLPLFRDAGIETIVEPLLDGTYLERRYQGSLISYSQIGRSYLRRTQTLRRSGEFDVIWVEKECLPWVPYFLERLVLPSGIPIVVDYDDAIFHRYDRHRSGIIRTLFRSKISRVMANAAAVVVGNEYLQQYALDCGVQRVFRVPTAVDVDRYLPNAVRDEEPFRIGWVGSPVTKKYLSILDEPLRKLAAVLCIELVVIGGGDVSMRGVPVRNVEWSEETEAGELARCDVGVMPLEDDPWARGKCGLKILQYMAAGIPMVASPVGANKAIIENGAEGFLAAGPEEWFLRLKTLAADTGLREKMRTAGRSKVQRWYSLEVVASQLLRILHDLSLASGGPPVDKFAKESIERL